MSVGGYLPNCVFVSLSHQNGHKMDSFYFISDCEGVISDSIYVRFISFVQSIENKDTFVSTLRFFHSKFKCGGAVNV